MRPVDIEFLVVPGRPALRGNLLLTAVGNPDPESNTARSSVRRIALDGGESAWTRGPRDSAPAISPDGQWVAFLRADKDPGARPQLYVMPAAGGEAKQLTALHLGAGDPVWAPDSRRIAFVARVPEAGRYGTAGEDEFTPDPPAEAPRRITRMDYRWDDIGFVVDRRKRLFVVDALAEGEPVRPEPLTGSGFDAECPAWTPDGARVVFTAPPEWGATESDIRDVCAIPAEGGEPEVIVSGLGYSEHPAFTADGTLVYFGQSYEDGHREACNTGVYAAEPVFGEGPVKPRRLTEIESVDCESAAGPPVPHADGVLVAVRNRGAVELRTVPLDAVLAPLADLPVVYAGRTAVRSFTVDGPVVVAVVATPTSSGDVFLLGDGAPLMLTDYSKPLRGKGLRPVVELDTTAPDGYPVHGWLVLPEGAGPHPVLRVVHGGPFTQQDWAVFDEAQVYAAAGYAVVLGNPRGSAGYGQAHGRAITRAYGTVDVDDVLALLDVALERPDLDASRVGIMGGSYGGFMTSWLAAHHGERFKAAWSERAVNAWDSFLGSSDIGYTFVDAYVGSDPEVQRERSPLTYADRIRIPFCVAHSEEDWRCPVEQAQRMFVALRRAGVDAEFLLFPGEGHELTRSGKPRHRIQRFDAILDWWSRRL